MDADVRPSEMADLCMFMWRIEDGMEVSFELKATMVHSLSMLAGITNALLQGR